jgi:hypothetical protein
MVKLIGIPMIAAGVFAALGIWLPRLRARWRSTRTVCGPVSCAGFALVFMSMGFAFLCAEAVPQGQRNWFGLPMILGVMLVLVGGARDRR